MYVASCVSVEEPLESPPKCSSMQKRKTSCLGPVETDREPEFDGGGEAVEGEAETTRCVIFLKWRSELSIGRIHTLGRAQFF